ncbi:hypothetical protein RB608_10870 [Nocardioides sp. LHD-245]|uniref:hypothetical protein n=1 Tax=Nocardioides sp. LHD-245 TaxID=3051387 RepID=UPI0027E1FB67|nr:hypothetical protein [Nocardioides sp. LHD-245]
MSYDVYQPGDAPEPGAAPPTEDELGGRGPWRVAIEYSNQGQAKPPTVVRIGQAEHADRTTAMLAAARAAREFDPPDPWSEQKREIFRDGRDGFLVIIEGATSTFHMSVRIVAPVVT